MVFSIRGKITYTRRTPYPISARTWTSWIYVHRAPNPVIIGTQTGTSIYFTSPFIRANAKGIRPDENRHNHLDHASRQGLEETPHAGFGAAEGRMLEDGNPRWRDEGPSIPTRRKGKEKATIRDQNDGGAMPEEQDVSGYSLSQPESQPNPCVAHAR